MSGEVEALARVLNPALGGIIPLDWSVVEGADFLTQTAETVLASPWLAAHVAAERAAAVEEALREVRSLAEKWHEHRMAWCRACRDREFAQIHSHDCGMTRRDAEAALRAVLPAAGEGEA